MKAHLIDLVACLAAWLLPLVAVAAFWLRDWRMAREAGGEAARPWPSAALGGCWPGGAEAEDDLCLWTDADLRPAAPASGESTMR